MDTLTRPHTEGKAAPEAFTSTIPFQDQDPDCLVITCSDHRFREQTREFLVHLGFTAPHAIAVPGGAVITDPLLSAFGNIMPKAMHHLMERVIEMKRVPLIVCIAHENCGAYRAGKHKLLNALFHQVSGKSVRDAHLEHLQAAARRIKHTMHGIAVRAFFAKVEEGTEKRVTFTEVTV